MAEDRRSKRKDKRAGRHAKPETSERSKRTRSSKGLSSKQKKVIAAIVAVFIFLGVTYGRTILKLQLENRELKQQQEELQKEKSKLTKELKNVNSKDYIQEQARKHLGLLSQDEIMFIFQDDDAEDTAAETDDADKDSGKDSDK